MTKKLVKELNNIKPHQIKIKEIRKQLTLDGNEDVEVEGWISAADFKGKFLFIVKDD